MANSVRWFFNFSKWTPTEADILLAAACVQIEEKERLLRFVFKKDFKSSLIGRLMMRKFVHQTTDIPYNEIKFSRDGNGKPILLFPNLNESVDLAFNVSHQGNFVVLAGEVGTKQLGVDIMKMEYTGGKSLSEYFRIMRKPFAELEWNEIKGSGTEKDQIAMFCRHWCLKESYVKAIGVGITVNLQDIRFKIHSKHIKQHCFTFDTELFVGNEKKNWIFEETLIDEDHCVAVALCCEKREGIEYEELNFTNLMSNAIPLLDFDQDYCKKYFTKLDTS